MRIEEVVASAGEVEVAHHSKRKRKSNTKSVKIEGARTVRKEISQESKAMTNMALRRLIIETSIGSRMMIKVNQKNIIRNHTKTRRSMCLRVTDPMTVAKVVKEVTEVAEAVEGIEATEEADPTIESSSHSVSSQNISRWKKR